MTHDCNDTKKRQGGRKPTGTIITLSDGRFQAIVTLCDGSRKRIPPFPKGTSREAAREKEGRTLFATLTMSGTIWRGVSKAVRVSG